MHYENTRARFDRGGAPVRFDRGELASAVKRVDGSTVFTGRVARTGPLKYPWGVERRDSRELDAIVNQLTGAPITLHHPRRLFSDGVEYPKIGVVERAWREDGFVLAELRVDDAIAIRRIRSGVSQLSLGYALEDVVKGFQRGTRVDHVAFVRVARCGPSCSVRLDSDCCGHGTGSTNARAAALAVNITRTYRNG